MFGGIDFVQISVITDYWWSIAEMGTTFNIPVLHCMLTYSIAWDKNYILLFCNNFVTLFLFWFWQILVSRYRIKFATELPRVFSNAMQRMLICSNHTDVILAVTTSSIRQCDYWLAQIEIKFLDKVQELEFHLTYLPHIISTHLLHVCYSNFIHKYGQIFWM